MRLKRMNRMTAKNKEAMLMDTPLERWYCDVCDKPIEDAKAAYVIWKSNDESKSYDFKIIHQSRCHLKDYDAYAEIEEFLGEDGLATLFAMLSLGPIKRKIRNQSYCDVVDMDEFVDFMRRVQTPYYEEARRKFVNCNLLNDYSDANEVFPYLPDQLKAIINNY